MRKVRNLVFYALCAAITVVSKEIIAFLPNVELVSFLLILFALHFHSKGSILIAVVFCFIQIVLYGIGMWTPMYFIVWIALVLIVAWNRKFFKTSERCAVFSACFGFSFGFLFSIPYFIISLSAGWIYFLKGIPFDLVHGIANFIIMLLLYDRISSILSYFHKRYDL